jgi:hypothetical protein
LIPEVAGTSACLMEQRSPDLISGEVSGQADQIQFNKMQQEGTQRIG